MMTTERQLLQHTDSFARRHIGPEEKDVHGMLQVLQLESLEQLVDRTIPAPIRLKAPLNLGTVGSEFESIEQLKNIALKNQIFRSFIGLGYSDCITPPVIQRNILENPGWYTQYTPYQSEIAQGRLEALLNFQTMIMDFTGLPIANASMLDEGTAAAEAMNLFFTVKGRHEGAIFFVSSSCHPQTIEVVRTRAEPLGVKVVVGNHDTLESLDSVFGILLQYPATDGTIHNYKNLIERAHAGGALVAVASDLLSLALLVPPGEFGADVVVGSAQRFGVPLGFGGPHAAYFATKEEYKRIIPGRIVGLSKDVHGKLAIRLALQTREQHIRRDKATSNICTSQVLLAVIASMYAVYHGPEGIKEIAQRIFKLASLLKSGLARLGYETGQHAFFDTLRVQCSPAEVNAIVALSLSKRINLRLLDSSTLGVSVNETTSLKDLIDLLGLFAEGKGQKLQMNEKELSQEAVKDLPADFSRKSNFLTHSVFNTHHSETEMLRYISRLQGRDLSLTTSMIPLGSCTMKLNATSEMLPVTWPEFNRIHPFAPQEQVSGYRTMLSQLENMLKEITGFAGVSLQPNAGSQGEFAGLLVIRKYHLSRGDTNRNICLIPKSAHGTNPASAVMAGMKVVVVECDSTGNVDVNDLRSKAIEHSKNLSSLMITYPSTHGVFEEEVSELCSIVHENGGLVYMDGANMNAQIALCRPGDFGPDVCHLNLHKTFCIPHGGGGPGMGPIGVAQHLVPFLPTHPLVSMGATNGVGPISAAPWGSASILVIPWMYISMMGFEGLKRATQVAILNANYIAKRLEPHYPVLYKGKNGFVAHECILDFRQFKQSGIEVEDVAKRLMDYGFHAPTVSFPVAGTMMVEPTESESKEEIDRFCEAMILIREEIRQVESGQIDRQSNLLKNAPHTADEVTSTEWKHPYSREQAAFPAPWLRQQKFWPFVGRINNVLGDRNLICACPPMEEYM